MLEAVRNAFRLPDLRQKLLITFGILALYRFAANIPLPGVNREVLASVFNGNNDTSMLLSLLNFFSGGGLSQMASLYKDLPPLMVKYILADHEAVDIRPPRWGDASGVRGAAWLWPRSISAPRSC